MAVGGKSAQTLSYTSAPEPPALATIGKIDIYQAENGTIASLHQYRHTATPSGVCIFLVDPRVGAKPY